MKKLYYILSILLTASISFTAFAFNDTEGNNSETKAQKEVNEVKIYPNPFISSINLELDWISQEETIVRIFNIIGKQIFLESFEPGMVQILINTDSFEKGIYFVEIKTGNKLDTQRIIKH